MNDESNNPAAISELDGQLRTAVGLICSAEIPRDRMQRCLDRVMDIAPAEISSGKLETEQDPASSRAVRTTKRRLWFGVAVGVAVVTVMAVIPFTATAVSLADVAHAVSRQPWIHVTEHASYGNREVWYSPVDDVSATRKDDWIEYFDHKLKVFYSYDIAEGVLYRVPEIGTVRRQSRFIDISETLPLLLADGVPAGNPLAKMGFLNGRPQEWKLLEQRLDKVTDDGGHKWLDYTLTVRMREGENPTQVLFRVDPESKLPNLNRVTREQNGETVTYEATFDYPHSGPRDVYDIGVPRDAKLVDRIPTDDVARLVAGVEAGRVRFDDFRAIVVRYSDGIRDWWRQRPDIIHRKGTRIRRDLVYYWTSPPVEPANDVDVDKWWKKRVKAFRYYPTRICIDGTDYSFKHRSITAADGTPRKEIESVQSYVFGGDADQFVPAFWSLSPDCAARPPLGIPSQLYEAVVDTHPKDGPEGTVLLRVRRSGRVDAAPNQPMPPDEYRYWIDPAREYLVMRIDMMGGEEKAQSSLIVESVAQSPKGHWYPTRVRQTSSREDVTDSIMEYHVEFGVDIPDALFDIKQPMTVEEALQQRSR